MESDDGSDDLGYKRGGLWYEDGNVILVAEGTGFCVYKGILTDNSDDFGDMLVQSANGETWEDRPVLHLSVTKAALFRVLQILCKTSET